MRIPLKKAKSEKGSGPKDYTPISYLENKAQKLRTEGIQAIEAAHVYDQMVSALTRLVKGSSNSEDTTQIVRDAFVIARGPLRARDILAFMDGRSTRQRVDQILARLAQQGEIRITPRIKAVWVPVCIRLGSEILTENSATLRGGMRKGSNPWEIISRMQKGVHYTRQEMFDWRGKETLGVPNRVSMEPSNYSRSEDISNLPVGGLWERVLDIEELENNK